MLREFLVTETAGGVLLVVAALVALVWANSPWQDAYRALWHTELGVRTPTSRSSSTCRSGSTTLMALFFLVIGLEVKHELALGEFRKRRCAALPVLAAVGGMLVPRSSTPALNGRPSSRARSRRSARRPCPAPAPARR